MRYCKARRGVAWPGLVRLGVVWHGFSGEKFLCGGVGLGKAWHCEVRQGPVWLGAAWYGVVSLARNFYAVRRGMVRHGMVGFGLVRRCVAW